MWNIGFIDKMQFYFYELYAEDEWLDDFEMVKFPEV